jgi:manganese efflux pump family protein
MIREAFSGDEEDGAAPSSRGHYAVLALAAVATSIDAAAAGITLPLLALPPFLSCLIIGGVTGALCLVASRVGGRVRPGSTMAVELLGGLALIGVGTRILVEHLAG